MNSEPQFSEEVGPGNPVNVDLLEIKSEALNSYVKQVSNLTQSLGKLAEIGDANTISSSQHLQHQISEIEPSITMIGQVKAGKTSLVNAMVGWPELLPADVNPWTSVVTS